MDVLDAILETVEPGGAMNPDTAIRRATSGTEVDHTGARPFSIDLGPERLYGWLTEDRHLTFETGPAYRENFAFSLLLVLPAGEQADAQRSRSLSEAIDTRAHLLLDRIAANATAGPWMELGGGIDDAALTGFSVRGIGLRVSGWRYRPA